jgi:protein dithiol oxidoreductase (disulfide-forming)
MQRRIFTSLAAISAVPTFAQTAGFTPGRDFLQLNRRASTEALSHKIEVVDFFWYSCPHCNAFEPALEAWIAKLPSDIHLRRIPVQFRDDFEPQQRLYFTLENMGKVRELHGRVFEEIHQHRRRLTTEAQILSWADSRPELDSDRFRQLFNSFTISAKVAKATLVQNEYSLGGVPALGVAGQYYVDGNLAQNMQRALQIVDALVASIRQAPKSS